MCEFISYIEIGKEILFLTSDDLHSSRGRKLKKHLGEQYHRDVMGHGAIKWFFDMPDKGTHRECVDFSTPDNFPPIIVQAIKDGKFRGFGIAEQLLTKPAWAEYNKVQQPAWAKYNKVQQLALAKYNKVQQLAMAEYNKVQKPAWAEYNKVQQPAWAKYKKVEQTALAEYKKVQQDCFWNLFANPKNRAKAWM